MARDKIDRSNDINLTANEPRFAKLPPIWKNGPQTQEAKNFASQTAKGIDAWMADPLKHDRPPRNFVDWVILYGNTTRHVKWLKYTEHFKSIEMGEDSTSGFKTPGGNVVSGHPDGSPGDSLTHVMFDSSMKYLGNVTIAFMQRMSEMVGEIRQVGATAAEGLKEVTQTAIKEIRGAHNDSSRALSSANSQLSRGYTGLMGLMTGAFKGANEVQEQSLMALGEYLKLCRDKEIPVEQRDTFDKIIDSIKVTSPGWAPALLGAFKMFGLKPPKEIRKAIANIATSALEDALKADSDPETDKEIALALKEAAAEMKVDIGDPAINKKE